MRHVCHRLLAGLAGTLLVACATQPEDRVGRVVDRLPANAAPAIAGLSRLTLDDIQRMSQAGMAPEAIIDRLKTTASRHRLSASDVLSLRAAGVPLAVIDHLLAAERQGLLDECSTRINQRESEAAMAREQAEAACRQSCALSCPPYGGFGPYPPYFPGRRWP